MHCETGLSLERLQAARATARQALLAERADRGNWVGELSTSALSTATSISALATVIQANSKSELQLSDDESARIQRLIAGGVSWLTAHQNSDGGWGDTDQSYSNISTTLLVQAAFRLAGVASEYSELLLRAERYVHTQGSWLGLRKRYGRDKTFAVPILTNCALAGMVEWREVSPLPFELACFPQSMYRLLSLPVVSYAIPALVAIGQARFFHRRPWNPITRWIRTSLVEKSLKVLERMQPQSGGYLEAVPLTSFVVMSLATTGRADHTVTRNGLQFILNSVRPDGSWPIDTNLATWNTTSALNSLAAGNDDLAEHGCLDWLLDCQTKHVHPFTGAQPGGWGWTDLTGSVPDADDTPSALLALATWSRSRQCSRTDRRRIRDAAAGGLRWLLGLQNRNGGWPTFCRGWGKLPFDRSGADLTAHAIRALHAWSDLVDSRRELQRGLQYLSRVQRSDGSWIPLWFGNQDAAHEENPVYGTAKVLMAYRDLGLLKTLEARRALAWLRTVQNVDGGWGGGMSLAGPGCQVACSSVEETALAVEVLLASSENLMASEGKAASHKLDSSAGHETRALMRGLDWLVNAVETDHFRKPSPIGFYFAKLWYHEKLYPIIFTTSALGRAVQIWSGAAAGGTSSSHTHTHKEKSLLGSVAADSESFPERQKSKRSVAPTGKDDTVSAVTVIKQPCP